MPQRGFPRAGKPRYDAREPQETGVDGYRVFHLRSIAKRVFLSTTFLNIPSEP